MQRAQQQPHNGNSIYMHIYALSKTFRKQATAMSRTSWEEKQKQKQQYNKNGCADITGCESRFQQIFRCTNLIVLMHNDCFCCILPRGWPPMFVLCCVSIVSLSFFCNLHELQGKMNKFTILRHIPKIIMKLLEHKLFAIWPHSLLIVTGLSALFRTVFPST